MEILIRAIDFYRTVIIVAALITWVRVPRDNPIVQVLSALTEPVFRLFRGVLDPSRTGGFDISPLLVLVLLSVLRSFLIGML